MFVDGCSELQPRTNIIDSNYNAVDKLLAKGKVDRNSLLIVATVVDINHIENSSPLGRTISEQVVSRLVEYHMQLIEMKLRNNIYIKNDTGELMLSRNVEDLAKQVKADAVIVGTYSNSYDTVYVNLKIINPLTNVIISTVDYKLPKDKNIRILLGESIPFEL